jgi:hypothetical protein
LHATIMCRRMGGVETVRLMTSMLVGILSSEEIDNTAAVHHERFELVLSQSLVVQLTAGYRLSAIGLDRRLRDYGRFRQSR